MNTPRPGLFPRAILEREDLRLALREHDFAAVFALIKKYGGLSQNRIAAACTLTPGKVSRIISGSQQVTSYDVISRIADGLRLPGHLLGLSARPWEQQEEPCEPPPPHELGDRSLDDVPWCPGATVDMAARMTRSDLAMDRRTASRALTAAAITGAALLDPLEGWLQPSAAATPSRQGGRLAHSDIDQLEQTTRAFRQWDHRYGGGLGRKAIVGQLNEVATALEDHQTAAIEKRLYRVMAYLSGTAATMAWDSGHQRRAQDYYRLALRCAHAGDDIEFGANVLAGMARQMLYQNRPQDALELVRLAQGGARHTAGPRVRAMLHTREAWALSAMGRTAAFRRTTEQAKEALAGAGAGSGEEPYWIAYFDDAELAGVTGGRLLDLARQNPAEHAEEAAEHIRSALTARGPEAGRSHALDRIGLAECHFLAGDTKNAVNQTHQAVDAAQRTQSSRVRTQLATLYPYTVGHGTSRSVREARDRVRSVLSKR